MELIDKNLKLSQLLLDPNNYRLDYERDVDKVEDDKVVAMQDETQDRLEKERLGELRESIVDNGFLEMDRIVVRRLKSFDKSDLFVVVEGNRRTAALKGLVEDYYSGFVDLPQSLLDKTNSIGVVCIEGDDDEIEDFAATLMGIRHVSGPKKWTGYQSARLIDDLFQDGKSLGEIGSLLGITAKDAGRRMRGYRAFLQMRGDKDFRDFSEKNHYTLFLEFLSPSRGGREWLDWDEDGYRFRDSKNLRRLYSAITSGDGERPEINSPTDARDFLKHLRSKKHRKLIEKGIKLIDLPPFNLVTHDRLKELNKIYELFVDLKDEQLSTEEMNFLNKIYGEIDSLLSGGQE